MQNWRITISALVEGDTLRKSLPCEAQKTSYTKVIKCLGSFQSRAEQSRAGQGMVLVLHSSSLGHKKSVSYVKLLLSCTNCPGVILSHAPTEPSQSVFQEAYVCSLVEEVFRQQQGCWQREQFGCVSLHNVLDYMHICSLQNKCVFVKLPGYNTCKHTPGIIKQ